MDSEEIKWLSRTFKKVEVFDGLTVSESQELIEQLEKLTFKKNQIVFEEGDPLDCFYIIFKGKVKIVKKKMIFRKVDVSVLKSGEFFGELALLTYKPRTATVIALEKTVCFVLFKSVFLRLIKRNISFRSKLQTTAFKRALELKKI